MAQADSKVLVLGALAGVAGISLAVVCYQGFRSRRRASLPAFRLNRTNEQGSGIMLVDGPCLPSGQAEVLDRLEALIQCVSELKEEMKSLKNALPTLQDQVRQELRGREEARRAGSLHRTTPTRKKRTVSEARAAGRSSEEAESEGGYMTALTDSEEEEPSEAEERDQEQPADKLTVLIERIDRLHQGSECDKRESLNILLEEREEFGQNSTFLWRLVRAYCDVHDISSTLEEKTTHAETGKKVGEEAVRINPTCAESHQCWQFAQIIIEIAASKFLSSLHLRVTAEQVGYAIMCGIMAEYDTIQNKIKNGYVFKDHLDKAIELKPQDPLSYYLLGRWCYAVSQLSWIERKVASTLFGEPPVATVEDALKNFLKVEELHPAYSKLNYVFLAKCYKDLGKLENAKKMCEAACSMSAEAKEDEEAQKELSLLCPALGL